MRRFLSAATGLKNTGLAQLSKICERTADVNGDGSVCIPDTTCVQKYVAEYTDGIGSTEDSFVA